MKYTIRRVSLLSFAKFGCLLGALVAFLPGALCSLTGLRVIHFLRRWLESWREAEISALGLTTTLDFVKLLRLEPILHLLQTFDRQSWPTVLAAVLVASLVAGLLIGLSALLAGWGYNVLAWLTGGVEIELREK